MRRLAPLLKVAVPVVLLTYLFQTGAIDLRRFLAVRAWWLVALGLLTLVLQATLAARRWQVLLASQGLAVTLAHALRLTLIGMFFSIALPGAMGGDLVKGYYIARTAPGKGAAAVSTVVLDRLIGLVALLTIDGLLFLGMWALNPDLFARHPELRLIAYACAAILLGMVLGLAGLLSGWLHALLGRLAGSGRLPFAGALAQLGALLAAYSSRPRALAHAFALALAVQAITPPLFVLLAMALGQPDLSPLVLMLLVPIVMTSNAIPISLMGLGVGETAMIQLLALVLPPGSPNMGGEMMIMFRILTILVALPGAVLWLLAGGGRPVAPADEPPTGEPAGPGPSEVPL